MSAQRHHEYNALDLPELFDALARNDAEAMVTRGLAEDLGATDGSQGFRGDLTSAAAIAPSTRGRATIVSRADGTLAGLPVVHMVAQRAGLACAPHLADGMRVTRGSRIATLEGPYAAMLAHERTMLNFLTLLSGNATLTARFVEAVHGTRAKICDTRKTIPGLRTLQKYATRCGGGTLHRIGLFDAVLLKDNHLGVFEPGTLGARVRAAAQKARAIATPSFVECEVDSLAQLDELLEMLKQTPNTIDLVLLDNMDAASLADAVARRDACAPALLLEASGGVRLDSVRTIALSGVDRISVGAITHSAPALDLGLDFETRLDQGA